DRVPPPPRGTRRVPYHTGRPTNPKRALALTRDRPEGNPYVLPRLLDQFPHHGTKGVGDLREEIHLQHGQHLVGLANRGLDRLDPRQQVAAVQRLRHGHTSSSSGSDRPAVRLPFTPRPYKDNPAAV